MLTMSARKARRVAGWAGIACAALLVTACGAQGSPTTMVTDAPNPSVAYLAQGQDLHGKMLFEPACNGFGCALKLAWRRKTSNGELPGDSTLNSS